MLLFIESSDKIRFKQKVYLRKKSKHEVTKNIVFKHKSDLMNKRRSYGKLVPIYLKV